MFNAIRFNDILRIIECQLCSERNAFVEFDESLCLQDGFLNYDKVIILKPDSYYNTKNFAQPPSSPDCLIMVKCNNEPESYVLYLIELRDTNHKELVNYEDVVKKFESMINQFFEQFVDIFGSVNYKKIEFYLVTTYLTRKNKSLFLDAYLRKPELSLFGKRVQIIPKSSPFKISAC